MAAQISWPTTGRKTTTSAVVKHEWYSSRHKKIRSVSMVDRGVPRTSEKKKMVDKKTKKTATPIAAIAAIAARVKIGY